MEEEQAVPSIYDQLKQIAADRQMKELFEEQRKNIGKAYSLQNQITEASKDGIASLKHTDLENAEACRNDMENYWQDLLRLNLPKDIAWQHQAEAGQEMVEFVFVSLLYPCLLDESAKLPQLPSNEELMVYPQTWLAGIGDAVGELGKLTDDLLCENERNREERKNIRRRFLKIAKEIYDFLERYETVYGQVINNSRRRGYGNTYRGLLGRVRGAINRQKTALIEFFDREAK